ncbi:unnamed protein product, partial [Closterium sp. NIES-64]
GKEREGVGGWGARVNETGVHGNAIGGGQDGVDEIRGEKGMIECGLEEKEAHRNVLSVVQGSGNRCDAVQEEGGEETAGSRAKGGRRETGEGRERSEGGEKHEGEKKGQGGMKLRAEGKSEGELETKGEEKSEGEFKSEGEEKSRGVKCGGKGSRRPRWSAGRRGSAAKEDSRRRWEEEEEESEEEEEEEEERGSGEREDDDWVPSSAGSDRRVGSSARAKDSTPASRLSTRASRSSARITPSSAHSRSSQGRTAVRARGEKIVEASQSSKVLEAVLEGGMPKRGAAAVRVCGLEESASADSDISSLPGFCPVEEAFDGGLPTNVSLFVERIKGGFRRAESELEWSDVEQGVRWLARIGPGEAARLVADTGGAGEEDIGGADKGRGRGVAGGRGRKVERGGGRRAEKVNRGGGSSRKGSEAEEGRDVRRKGLVPRVSDAVPIEAPQKSHVSDAVPIEAPQKSHVSDAVPIEAPQKSHVSDAVPIEAPQKSHVSDAVPIASAAAGDPILDVDGAVAADDVEGGGGEGGGRAGGAGGAVGAAGAGGTGGRGRRGRQRASPYQSARGASGGSWVLPPSLSPHLTFDFSSFRHALAIFEGREGREGERAEDEEEEGEEEEGEEDQGKEEEGEEGQGQGNVAHLFPLLSFLHEPIYGWQQGVWEAVPLHSHHPFFSLFSPLCAGAHLFPLLSSCTSPSTAAAGRVGAGGSEAIRSRQAEGRQRLVQVLTRCMFLGQKKDAATGAGVNSVHVLGQKKDVLSIPRCSRKGGDHLCVRREGGSDQRAVKLLSFSPSTLRPTTSEALSFSPQHAASYNEFVEDSSANLLLADWMDPSHEESLLKPPELEAGPSRRSITCASRAASLGTWKLRPARGY